MNAAEKELYMKYCKYDKEPKEVILELIQVIEKQQAEIEKKDKIIKSAMECIANHIGSRTEICKNMNCDKAIEKECKICALEYFTNKV